MLFSLKDKYFPNPVPDPRRYDIPSASLSYLLLSCYAGIFSIERPGNDTAQRREVFDDALRSHLGRFLALSQTGSGFVLSNSGSNVG